MQHTATQLAAMHSQNTSKEDRSMKLQLKYLNTTKIFIAIAFIAVAPLGHAGFIVGTGVYDENTVQTNAVDTEATTLTSSAFGSMTQTAYTNGNGGVIDFDSGGTFDIEAPVNGTPYFNITFGSSNEKSVRVERTDGGGYTDPTSDDQRTAISGSLWMSARGKGGPTNPNGVSGDVTDFVFEFGDISGGATNEVISSIGATILSRDNDTLSDGVDFTATAYFNDGTDSGGVTSEISQSNGGDDTFFGITAPEGRWITKFVISPDDGTGLDSTVFTGLDDLGFTTTVIPEPASVLLLALGSLALLRRPRRR